MKIRFEEVYRRVATEYSNAVQALSKADRNKPETLSGWLLGQVVLAHIALTNARWSLEMHQREHGC
jgi:hypothetical protein